MTLTTVTAKTRTKDDIKSILFDELMHQAIRCEVNEKKYIDKNLKSFWHNAKIQYAKLAQKALQ